MQPPDEQQSPSSPPDSHSEIPDDTSRTEQGSVSTKFQPGTDRILKRGALLAAGILALGFVVVTLIRLVDAHSLRKAADLAYSAAPPVDVITVRPAQIGQDLILPGQTAAWFETTIYARVNGYVAKWLVDIGDHVKKGQVLAIIETPELDAELNAAKAQLKSSEAQVAAREAEAQFSKSTNERWRDSPKGVVSDQEREAKKADYESANARLYAANAQVALDKSKVDQYRDLAEFKQVVAPFDGTITERKIDIGNLVTAGSASNTTPLYRMAQTDPLRVFVDVPAKRGRRIEGRRARRDSLDRVRGRRVFRDHRALGGVDRCAGADHAGRGRHAQCQARLAAGDVRQRRLPARAERFGRSASRSPGVPPAGHAGGAS